MKMAKDPEPKWEVWALVEYKAGMAESVKVNDDFVVDPKNIQELYGKIVFDGIYLTGMDGTILGWVPVERFLRFEFRPKREESPAIKPELPGW
jgi:hypothetical protein